MRFRTRTILPITLVAAGAALLVGCFYLPLSSPNLNQQASGYGQDIVVRDPNALPDGDPAKDQSLHYFHTGLTRRDDVLAILHQPAFASADGQVLLYAQERRDGYWVWPLCFYAGVDCNGYYVRLNFDIRGILISSSQDQRTYYDMTQDSSFIESMTLLEASKKNGTPYQWPPPLPQRMPTTHSAAQ